MKKENFTKSKETKEDSTKSKSSSRSGNAASGSQGITNWNVYSKNPQLLKDVASLSFNTLAGYNAQFTTLNELNIPGIAILSYVHGIPSNGNVNDIVNRASRKLFGTIRKGASGYSAYDPNDLMIYCLAIAEVYVMHSNVMRAIGLCYDWDPYTRYQPRMLVEALGFDYDDMIANATQWRGILNSIRAELAMYPVPKVMSFFEREYALPSFVLKDSNNNKSQYIAMRPYVYRVYEDTENGGRLVAKELAYAGAKPRLLKWTDVKSYMREMQNGITGSDSVGLIVGDINRVMTPEMLWALPEVTEDYRIQPIVDYAMLTQIQNAQLVGGPTSVESLNITEDNSINKSTVVYRPTVSTGVVGTYTNPYINAHTNETDPLFVADATRLKAYARTAVGSGEVSVDYCGLEFITAIDLFNNYWCMELGSGINGTGFARPSNITEVYQLTAGYINLPSLSRDEAMKVSRMVYMYNTFNWMPALWLSIPKSGESAMELYPIMDLDNYTIMSLVTLQSIHEVVNMSYFDIIE